VTLGKAELQTRPTAQDRKRGIDENNLKGHNVHNDVFSTGEETMIEIGVADIRANLADVINRVAYGGERIILQRRGKQVLAVVSMEDLELLNALEDRADVKAAKKARKEKGGVTLEQYRKKHGM
jgi:prevent-host-death family protein